MKKYPVYNYATLSQSDRSMTDMRSEYAALRRTALGRIERLRNNKLTGYSTNIDAFIKQGFPTSRTLTKNPEKMMQGLAAVSQFLNNPLSLTRGMKSKIKQDIDIFSDYFEDPSVLNAGNLKQFYDFLEEFRSAAKGQIYSSEFIFSVWETSERVGISKKSLLADINYWAEHQQDLREIPERTNKNKISSYAAKRMLAKARKKGK